MKRNKLFKLLFALIISLPALSQTNPRLVNENYMQKVLFEDFLGTQLTSLWRVEPMMRSIGVLADDPRTLEVLDDNLKLSMIYSQNYSSGGYTGDYVGAEIITNTAYKYGSFECRAKFAYQNGSWPAFWLFGGDDTPCSQGGKLNEIDIAELKCDDSNLTIDHVIHYYYAPSQCNGQEQDFEDSSMSFDSNYHLFKCIWTPDKITYYIDGVQTYQRVNSGQEWFPSRSLEIRLSQQIIDPIGAPVVPQTSYFDYVRVKQFFLAPEITVPELTCSTGTATMDVDPQATNITWQLTPAHFFTTTSGSGKIASFVRAANANGVGKIIYTFQMPSGETFTAEKEILVGAQKPETITYAMDAPPGRFTTFIEDVPTVTSYNWYLNGVKNNTYHGTSAVFPRKSPFCNVYYRVQVEAINPCGTSGKTLIDIYEPSCFYTLLLSPNPSSNETKIELVNGEEKTPAEDIEWSLEVYDQSQNLKTKVSKEKVNKHVINTSDWKEGLYIVHAVVGDEIISEKLRVEH